MVHVVFIQFTLCLSPISKPPKSHNMVVIGLIESSSDNWVVVILTLKLEVEKSCGKTFNVWHYKNHGVSPVSATVIYETSDYFAC